VSAYGEIREQDTDAGVPSVSGSNQTRVFRFPHPNALPKQAQSVKCSPDGVSLRAPIALTRLLNCFRPVTGCLRKGTL